MTSTSHVWRMFALLLGLAASGLVARQFLRPEGFGELGHYRAGSLDDIMSLDVVHQGREICRECHPKIYDVHAKDTHFGVQCEDCHGPGNHHVKYHRGDDTSIPADQAVMPKEYTLEGCLFCHRRLASRPRTFAQVDRVEHYRFLRISDFKIRCIDCHNPHEPLFLLENVNEARVHPVIFECEDCHDEPQEQDHQEIPGHPNIFICRDCHTSVVKDFEKHEHAFMRCTGCHLFYRENETSGRIFKNGNRNFCLLCHAQKPFKNKETLPQIVYSEHLVNMAKVMRRNPEEFSDDPTACLKCHLDIAHDNRLLKRLREQER